ncbi:MAG: SlyX family protein [Pseudomonadota bacterium]|nr:SlyX family protein [Pseudomonadota bacterium]
MSKELQARLEALEMRLAFQEQTIDELNTQMARQELDIRELWEAKQKLHRQLKDIAPSHIRSEAEETPPPHY